MKHISKVAAVLLLVVFALAVIGCNAKKDPVAGKTYAFQKDGAGTAMLSFGNDGTFTFSLAEAGGSELSGSGTYTVDGTSVTMTADGEAVTAKTSDNWKSISWNGAKLTRQ